MWLLLAILSAFFAALVAIFGKLGVDEIDPTVATLARSAVMFLVVLLATAAGGKLGGLSGIQGRPLLSVALAGVAGAVSWLFYFWALRLGKASQVATIDRLSLVFVIVLAAFFLGERVTPRSAFGAVLVVIGAILVAW
jgi:transporter family protein